MDEIEEFLVVNEVSNLVLIGLVAYIIMTNKEMRNIMVSNLVLIGLVTYI